MSRRVIAALLASLVCIVGWCSVTMPSEAELDRVIYCHDNPGACTS